VLGHRDYVIKTLLHGMTGPIGGESFAEVMVPMGSNTDEWIASVASYVRNAFGNAGTFVTPDDVARVRAATSSRQTPWTLDELEASLPVQLRNVDQWRASASHNANRAPGGLTFQGWTSAEPQAADMWYQVELPEPVSIVEVQFESTGGGGRGAPAMPPGMSPVGFPRGYRVQVSADGSSWRTVAEGQSQGSPTIATFEPATARLVRIVQTANVQGAPAWSIQNLRLYRAP
jgi:hypothetical protein